MIWHETSQKNDCFNLFCLRYSARKRLWGWRTVSCHLKWCFHSLSLSFAATSKEAELAPKREGPPGEATALEALLRADNLLEKKNNICKEEETLLEIQVCFYSVNYVHCHPNISHLFWAQLSSSLSLSLSACLPCREFWRRRKMGTVSTMTTTLNWILRRERTETEAKWVFTQTCVYICACGVKENDYRSFLNTQSDLLSVLCDDCFPSC